MRQYNTPIRPYISSGSTPKVISLWHLKGKVPEIIGAASNLVRCSDIEIRVHREGGEGRGGKFYYDPNLLTKC